MKIEEMIKRFYKIFIDIRGFTLMEILISMLILSIVAILILQGLRLGYKVWEKGELKIAHQQRMRIAFDTISKQLSSVYSFSVKEENGDLSPVFKVDPKMIQFVTSRPIGLRNKGGLFFVIYSLRNVPFSEKRVLVAYQKPVYMIEDFKNIDVSNEEAINLIPDIIDLEWSHSSWEIEEAGETLEMQKKREESLPKEVTLTLRLGEEDRSYLTKITIPIMVASKKPSKEKTKT